MRAFSLVELLVVIAIVVVLMALTGPALSPITRGAQLQQHADILASELQAARLEAISRNRPVEVRFSTARGPFSSSKKNFNRVEILATQEGAGFTPIRKAYELPDEFMFALGEGSESLSPLLDATRDGLIVEDDSEPDAKDGYIAFRFRPDGSIALPQETGDYWFLTVISKQDEGKVPTQEPRLTNFSSIMLDPFNGAIKILQPD